MFRVLLVAALLVVLGVLAYSYRAYFLINDVTTTPSAPPRFRASDGINEYPPENAVLQERYPDLKPLVLDQNPEAAFAHVKDIASQQPRWEIVFIDDERRKIEVVATTPLMRFQDDVVVEVRPEGSQGSSIHMRSRSRLGKGDLGANADRIKQFLDAMRETSLQQQD